jgi:superfamily II DNA helicase RecQ
VEAGARREQKTKRVRRQAHENFWEFTTMLARVVTLRFNSLLDGFDDAPLRELVKDKEVIAIRDHFFIKDEVPYLAVMVSYRPQPVPAAPAPTTTPAQRKRDESWREWVGEADVPLFNALRDWRSQRCKREGLPPYVICTNRQLAAMILARPDSLTKLGEIEGFGQAKLQKYGKDILALLAPATAPPTAAQSAAEDGEQEKEIP